MLDVEYLMDESTKSRKCSKSCFPQKSILRAKKQVRFSEASLLCVTSCKTESERKATWYSKRELARFKQNGKAEAQALSRTKSANIMKHIAYSVAVGVPSAHTTAEEETEMINGIEHMLSTEVLNLLVHVRRKTISRVLDEQKVQNDNGVRDPMRLALVSENMSVFVKDLRQRIACL